MRESAGGGADSDLGGGLGPADEQLVRIETARIAHAKGEALVAKLAGLQTDRINRALAEIGPAGTETVRQFLRAMIDRDDPDKVLETIFAASTSARG